MILIFLVFFLNVFCSNLKLEIYTNGSKYFYGEVPKNCNMSVAVEGVEVYNNQKLTNENTLIITSENGVECFRKVINTTPYTSSAIGRYIGYDNGWAYTFFLKKKNNSFQDNCDKNHWTFEYARTEEIKRYNFKVINNGNGQIMYNANQELLNIDFLKCIIHSIGKARDYNEEEYDAKKGIILGTEVQIHTYIPKTKLRKNIETGLWVIGFGTWFISAMTCLVVYSLAKQKNIKTSET